MNPMHAEKTAVVKPPEKPSQMVSSAKPPGARRSAARRLERGLFAFHRGDYSEALSDLEKVSDQALRSSDYSLYVESTTYLLRILAEREDFKQIARIEDHLMQILKVAEIDLRLKSRAMYVLGICHTYKNDYEENRHEMALRRFRDAVDFAVLAEDKEALAAPLYGSASVMYAEKNYDQALKELDRLAVLLSCLRLPDLASASHLLRSLVYRNKGQLDEAQSEAWAAFESLKHHPHLVLYLHNLTVLGTIYRAKNDLTTARLYLDLANRTLKRAEFPRIARLVDDAMASLGSSRVDTADLVFDTRTGILVEKQKGEIRFEGQFILRDLLRVFLENPGVIFTKEDLVRRVWKETYDPKIHDNKIYVTIKRLRKLLEIEESSGPKNDYVLRAKNGYFLNPKMKVLIHADNQNENKPQTEKLQ